MGGLLVREAQFDVCVELVSNDKPMFTKIEILSELSESKQSTSLPFQSFVFSSKKFEIFITF